VFDLKVVDLKTCGALTFAEIDYWLVRAHKWALRRKKKS
jgi:hypothetical protein